MWIAIILAMLVLLVIVIAVKTSQFKPEEKQKKEARLNYHQTDRVVDNMAKAVQFKTISYQDPNEMDMDEFAAMREFFIQAYPKLHDKLDCELINGATLVYYWQGKDKTKKPVLLMAHQDVVPADDETKWDAGAFSGAIKDGFVYGRGTLDTKIQIVTMMEAVEDLLNQGFVPARDIYFAYGHDEEQNGKYGAAKASEWFEEKGIEFEFVLDEGGCITEGALSGVNEPVAVIGTCEKGYMNVELTVNSKPGHASQPPKESAIGVLSKAVIALEKNPMSCELNATVEEMLLKTGPYMSLVNRIVISNLWLLKPLFLKIFSASRIGNAMLRTTCAVTMAKGSEVPNVIPQTASVTMNLRVAPGNSTKDVLDYIENTINNDEIIINPLYLLEPSPISTTNTQGYKAIELAINKISPDAVVTPYLMVAGTDSGKYVNLTESTYRFAPYRVSSEELDSIHGNNERISIENITRCVVFYQDLLTNV